MKTSAARKQYAPEFKAQAIELLGVGRPVAELAAELGIDPGPELGRLVDELAAACFTGEVGSASEAVEYARRLLDPA